MNSQNPLKNRILCLSLSAGIALLTGCATRPPREMGPPGKVQMPPSAPATDDLPPPVEVEVIPAGKEAIEREPAPPPKPKREPRAGTSYTIKKGESLSSIASRNKMSWKELAAYNHIANPDKVRVGQTILIPPSGSSKVSISPRREVAPPPAPPSGKTYVVQSGDNLSVIARRYGTNVKALKSANDLMSDRLLVGQVLKLPQGAETPERESRRSAEPEREPAAPRPTPIPMDVDDGMTEDVDDPEPQQAEADPVIDKAFPIVVQEGDTLKSIADDYIVTVEEIREVNNLPADAEVEPGQTLKIPPSVY